MAEENKKAPRKALFYWLVGGILPAGGHGEPVGFDQVKQGCNAHLAPRLYAVPCAFCAVGVVVVGVGLAPLVEQVKAGFIREFALDGHCHPCPFVTGQAGGDVAQGGPA